MIRISAFGISKSINKSFDQKICVKTFWRDKNWKAPAGFELAVTLEYWEGKNVKSWLTLLSVLIGSTSQYGDLLYNLKHVNQMIMV